MPIVGAIETPLADASRFGIIAVDEDRRILSFDEKPGQSDAHSRRPVPGVRLDGHLSVSDRASSASSSSATQKRARNTISAKISFLA